MKNSLMIFEGSELEILTKEDVNFEFEGTVLFNGKQVCEILEYNINNYAREITKYCDEENVQVIIKERLSSKMEESLKLNPNIITLGQRGTKFINEDGVFDLIYNSKMPKAKEFRKQVRKIVKVIQQTGKYDSIEEKIKLIQDEKERELSLGLYSLQQALKVNPNDMLLIINCKQKENELTTYKQQKQLELVNNKLIEQEKKLDNIFSIGDRIQFTNEVNRIARATGKQQSEIYNLTYNKFKSMYGIDLHARSKNRQAEIQNKRLKQGKRRMLLQH